MMPCNPAMMFCSIVGQASRQTAGPIGPSTIDRSNVLDFTPGTATEMPVYYAEPAVRLPLEEACHDPEPGIDARCARDVRHSSADSGRRCCADHVEARAHTRRSAG